MSEAVLMINAGLGRIAAARVEGLESKVKASMREVLKENWLTTNDDELFCAGVAGALLDVGKRSEDGLKILKSLTALNQFSSFIAASNIGLKAELPEMVDPSELVPLVGWWFEIKAEK